MDKVHTHHKTREDSIIHRREYNRVWMEQWRRGKGMKPNPSISRGIAMKKMEIHTCSFCKTPQTLSHSCHGFDIYLIIQKMKKDGYNSLFVSKTLNLPLEEVNNNWAVVIF